MVGRICGREREIYVPVHVENTYVWLVSGCVGEAMETGEDGRSNAAVPTEEDVEGVPTC